MSEHGGGSPLAEIFMLLRADTSKVGSDIKTGVATAGPEAEAAGKAHGSSYAGAFKAAAAAGVALGGFEFLKGSVEAFKDADVANTKLAFSFSKFPALADINKEALQGLNEEWENHTKFNSEAFSAAESTLAQFGITGKQLEELTPLVADYAAKTGTDLPDAATKVGKALIGQGRALKSVGIDFHDTKSLAGNYDELIHGLRGNLEGYADEEGKTAAGQTEILGNKFHEIQIMVGSFLVPTLKTLTTVLSDHIGTVFAVVGAVAALAVAYKATQLVIALTTEGTVAHTIVMGVAKAATVAWTAVQWALNAAFIASPIGWIVLGLAALVAGVIFAYNHFQVFHDIVDKAWQGIKDAAAATVDWFVNVAWPFLQAAWAGIQAAAVATVHWFTDVAWPALQAVWTGIATAALWLWHNIFEPVWTGIKTVIAVEVTAIVLIVEGLTWLWEHAVAPGLLWLWHNVFEPAWHGIQIAVQAVGDWFSNTLVPALRAVDDAIASGVGWLWHTVFEPFWLGIKFAVQAVANWFSGTLVPFLAATWNAIAGGVGWLWHTVFEPAWQGILFTVRVVLDWFTNTLMPLVHQVWNDIAGGLQWLWHSVFDPAWAGIQAVARGVVDWFSNTVVPIFNSVRDNISTAFGKLKDNISTAWDAIRNTAKEPIRFVVNTVFAGLVNTYNAVASKIGATTFDVPHVDFDQGGYTGEGGKYQPKGVVHGGEYVFTKDEVGAGGGPGFFAAIASGLRGYADGGFVGNIVGAIQSGASAIAGFLSDPVGSLGRIVDSLLGGISNSFFGKIGAGLGHKLVDGLSAIITSAFSLQNQQNTGGPLTTGSAGSASAANAIAWATRQLGTGGWLDRCLAFVNAAYSHSVGWLGTPRAIDSWNAAPGKHVGNTAPPAGAATYWQTGAGRPGHVALSLGGNTIISTDLPTSNYVGKVGLDRPATQWGARYLGWALPFDKGGWLPQGLSMSYNGTSGPERVLGPHDRIELGDETIRRLAERLPLMGDVTIVAADPTAALHEMKMSLRTALAGAGL